LTAVCLGEYFLGGYGALQELNPERWVAGGVYDPGRIDYSLTNIIYHLTFVFGLHPSYSFSTFLPDWSLSLEMQFYFVFPALWLILRRVGLPYAGLVIGIGAFIVGVEVSQRVHFYEPSLLLFKLNYFIAGILLHGALNESTATRRALRIGMAVVLCSLDWRYGGELAVLPALVVAMSWLGLLEVEGRSPEVVRRFVNGWLVRFASNSSYGVYLFHGFFISASGLIIKSNPTLAEYSPAVRVLLIVLFVLPLAYITGHCVFQWIEKPGVDLGKRVIGILGRRTLVKREA
jgi:peptidoglycan/LPS O-acetylase OafA/YrhL